MNTKAKKILSLSAISFAAGAMLLAGLNGKTFSKLSSGTCNHIGYHYAARDARGYTSGNKEFWTCCDCKETFLQGDEAIATGTWTDRVITSAVGGVPTKALLQSPWKSLGTPTKTNASTITTNDDGSYFVESNSGGQGCYWANAFNGYDEFWDRIEIEFTCSKKEAGTWPWYRFAISTENWTFQDAKENTENARVEIVGKVDGLSFNNSVHGDLFILMDEYRNPVDPSKTFTINKRFIISIDLNGLKATMDTTNPLKSVSVSMGGNTEITIHEASFRKFTKNLALSTPSSAYGSLPRFYGAYPAGTYENGVCYVKNTQGGGQGAFWSNALTDRGDLKYLEANVEFTKEGTWASMDFGVNTGDMWVTRTSENYRSCGVGFSADGSANNAGETVMTGLTILDSTNNAVASNNIKIDTPYTMIIDIDVLRDGLETDVDTFSIIFYHSGIKISSLYLKSTLNYFGN